MSVRKIFFLFSVILFLAFMSFSYMVAKETFVQWDFDTTVKFQDRLSHKLDLPFSLLSLIGVAEITGLIWVGIAVFALIKRFWLTLVALSTFIIATIIEVFGKVFVLHPGPPYLFYRGVLEFNFPTHYVATQYSYPSGHVLRTTFLVTFLSGWILLRCNHFWKVLFIPGLAIFLVLMAVSRVYLGEHWTTDVVGGFLLGGSGGLLSAATLPRLRRQTSTSTLA